MTDNTAYLQTKISQLDTEIDKHEALIEALREKRQSYEEQLPAAEFEDEAIASVREVAASFSGKPATPPAASSTEPAE